MLSIVYMVLPTFHVYMVLPTFHVYFLLFMSSFGQAIGKAKLMTSLRQKPLLQPILFEFRKIPFGLANSPSTFQRLMHAVLCRLQYDICLVYLDDIIIFSQTFDDYLKDLNDVFSRLRSANIRLKPSKCSFACSEVEYLGQVPGVRKKLYTV